MTTWRGRMASAQTTLPEHAEVAVVGSGYGGAIAAARLARAGRAVCVLERGREFLPGELPKTRAAVSDAFRVDTPLGGFTADLEPAGAPDGLYQLRVDARMSVLSGCGLGGTSLINANVVLRPDPRVLRDLRWPRALREDEGGLLAAGMAAAEAVLGAAPYPAAWPDPPKLAALREAGARRGWPVHRVPLAVSFRDGPNAVGIEQRACVGCGDCVSGCNHAAKNTLDQNYLPDAFHHGARIFTGLEVRRVERRGGRWVVHLRALDPAGGEAIETFLTADVVVLSAGVIGTTQILLRSRHHGLDLSDQLGLHVSSNRNVLGFGYDVSPEVSGVGYGDDDPRTREPVGPLITGAVDLRDTPDVDDGLIIEEGAVPGALRRGFLAGIAASAATLGRGRGGIAGALGALADTLESAVLGPERGALDHTLTLLAMGHDASPGRIALEADGLGQEHLRLHWPAAAQARAAGAESALAAVVDALDGVFVPNPAFAALPWHPLIAVQPLGGCVMADDAAHGAVDHRGRPFVGSRGDAVHPGLYVMDGSVVPRSTGLNPLLIISALAERGVRLLAAERGWVSSDAPCPLGRPPEPPPVAESWAVLRGVVSHCDGGVLGEGEARLRLGPEVRGARAALGVLTLVARAGADPVVWRIWGLAQPLPGAMVLQLASADGERCRVSLPVTTAPTHPG